jgi:simple sugar transport system permease protein
MSVGTAGNAMPDKSRQGQSRLSTFGSTFVTGGFTMYPVLLVLVIVGAVVAPRFATTVNLMNILEQVSVLGLTTIGLTFVVLIGRLDLSLEGIVGFAPMFAAVTLVPAAAGGLGIELPSWAGLFVALGTAGLIGLFNGFMVVRVGLNPFISTLGLLVLLRGGILIISNGRSIYSPGKALTYLGSEKLLGVPVSVLVFVAVATVVGLVFHYHRYGRALYAIGGNEEAARAAGINVDKVIWSAFVFAGLLAGWRFDDRPLGLSGHNTRSRDHIFCLRRRGHRRRQPWWRSRYYRRRRERSAFDWRHQQPADAGTSAIVLRPGIDWRCYHHRRCTYDRCQQPVERGADANLRYCFWSAHDGSSSGAT